MSQPDYSLRINKDNLKNGFQARHAASQVAYLVDVGFDGSTARFLMAMVHESHEFIPRERDRRKKEVKELEEAMAAMYEAASRFDKARRTVKEKK